MWMGSRARGPEHGCPGHDRGPPWRGVRGHARARGGGEARAVARARAVREGGEEGRTGARRDGGGAEGPAAMEDFEVRARGRRATPLATPFSARLPVRAALQRRERCGGGGAGDTGDQGMCAGRARACRGWAGVRGASARARADPTVSRSCPCVRCHGCVLRSRKRSRAQRTRSRRRRWCRCLRWPRDAHRHA